MVSVDLQPILIYFIVYYKQNTISTTKTNIADTEVIYFEQTRVSSPYPTIISANHQPPTTDKKE